MFIYRNVRIYAYIYHRKVVIEQQLNQPYYCLKAAIAAV